MKSVVAAAALGYLAMAPGARAQYAQGVDQGTLLSSNGIVAIPGQGYVPFPGGNMRAAYVFFGFVYYGYGATAIDASGIDRAVLNGTDITPATYQYSGALGIQPDLQQLINDGYDLAGFIGGTCNGSTCTTGPSHAAVWNAPGYTAYDLHPAGFVSSVAQALDGKGIVVGWATDNGGAQHPYLWSSYTAQALSGPAHFKQAAVAAISSLNNGGTLVDELGGYGTAKNGNTHPVVWVQNAGGTWTSFDVLPIGGISGAIVAADPADGAARFGGSVITKTSKRQHHAAFWNNPAAGAPNFTDLHPVGRHYVASSVYCESGAYGFQGGAVLVGTAKASSSHAMVWDGTAASAVDLQLLLPAGFVQSVVTGFDVYGNAEGSALDTNNVWHLVSWAYTAPAD